MGTRFDTLVRACLEEMADEKGSPHPVTGATTAAGDADSLIDTTNLKETGANADSSRYVGQWVRLMISATENIRKIKSYGPDTGTLVPESSFSGAPGSSNTYEIHRILEPARLKTAINDTLAELRYEDILPLTLVDDGDMEDTGTVTDKWGNDANGTPLKDTTYVLFGRQSLKCTAGAANGYTYPKTNVPVSPGEQLLTWGPAYGDQKGAKLVLYDVTNGADIEDARHNEEGWALLHFTATVPSGCYEVRPHLVTVTNGGAVYWDHVGLLQCSRNVYDSPSWLSKAQELIRLMSLRYGAELTSENAENACALWTYGPERQDIEQVIPAPQGVVPLRLDLQYAPTRPVLVVGQRNYPSLSADSDETEADERVVKAGALAFAYRRLGDDYAAQAEYWAGVFSRVRRGDEPGLVVRQVSRWRR